MSDPTREEYTPTTDEVAEVWAMSEPNPDGYTAIGLPVPDETEQRAEFDRWLARVRAEAYAHGYKRGYSDCLRGLPCTTVPNPYEPEEGRHVDQ